MIKSLDSIIGKILIVAIVFSSLLGVVYANSKNTLNSEIESQIQQIRLYKEPSLKDKTEASVKFKDIKDKIDNYYKETKNIKVSGDINDKKYQQLIISLGTNIEVLGQENKEEVLNFVKFIDLYENIEKNKEIKGLLTKYENGNLSSKEAEYLISISPNSDNMSSTIE